MERRLRQLSDILENDGVDKLLESLKNGSDFLEDVEDGNTITHCAALFKNTKMLQALKENELLELEVQNKMGQTPLFFAILSGSIENVRFFLESGASFDIIDMNGNSPLHVSATIENLDIVEFLSTSGVELNKLNKMNETALHIACKRGNLRNCIALVAAGVNPNAINLNGETALHLATKESLFEAVQALVMRGAHPNIQDQVGNIPLHIACINGDQHSVQYLCEHGSQVNVYNKETLTPLHYAAKTGDKEISRWLLYYGADPTLPNNLGITADIMAFAQGHTAVGKMLAQMTTSRAEGFREQLFPSNKNPRIKLKLFGAPRSGKTTFSESFRSVGVSYYIRRKFKALSEFADKFSENENATRNVPSCRRRSSVFLAEHESYTRGIDIKNTPEYSIWDFSGFKSYYFLYDYFIGNTSCVHMIFYSLRDNPSTQRENVKFWLEFIHSRIPAHEDGNIEGQARVVLVATHADETNCLRDGEGFLYHVGAARLLQDVRRKFKYQLRILPELHVLDTTIPNSVEMKSLKLRLQKLRDEILVELPIPTGIADIVLSQIEEWTKTMKLPVQYWEDFVQLIEKKANPLCTEANLRETVQLLQYAGDVLVLNANDGNDIVVLSPCWLLTDVIGNLFSQETLQHTRITGSFTTDDLQFIVAENDMDLVIKVLETLDCCVACLVQPEIMPAKERRRSIYSFYEDALSNAATVYAHTGQELQLEIPRLNLIQLCEDDWGKYLKGSNIQRTGIQLKSSNDQLIHIFPRIQCRLRRAIQEMEFSQEEAILADYFPTVIRNWQADPEENVVSVPELHQWMNGSKLSLCSGLVNIFVTCEEVEQAIEIKVETFEKKALLAFTYLHDTISLVRTTLDALCSRLFLSNYLLSFTGTDDGKVCKELISHPALFQLLQNEYTEMAESPRDVSLRSADASDGLSYSAFLFKSLFLQNPHLAAVCIYGEKIPASWVRYEILLQVCTTIGKNDGIDFAQLRILSDLLGVEEGVNETLIKGHDYVLLLNALLCVLLKWRASKRGRVGELVDAFRKIGQCSIASQIIEQLPVFVLRDESLENEQAT
uniref:Death-associated protein kinase 1 n=2 Tax=Schistocephalus solidus TaxID=70667 RepID=A0A0X3NY06_SCHSO